LFSDHSLVELHYWTTYVQLQFNLANYNTGLCKHQTVMHKI